ncbi:MAG: PadR family transcriptional regulator [Lachnospirales bacterium]
MDYDKYVIAQRRGSINVVVLSFLKTPKYGYELIKILEDCGYVIDQSTLYPLLRRLENEKILISEWRESNNRSQKYYVLTKEGKELWVFLCDEWVRTNKIIEGLIK